MIYIKSFIKDDKFMSLNEFKNICLNIISLDKDKYNNLTSQDKLSLLIFNYNKINEYIRREYNYINNYSIDIEDIIYILYRDII